MKYLIRAIFGNKTIGLQQKFSGIGKGNKKVKGVIAKQINNYQQQNESLSALALPQEIGSLYRYPVPLLSEDGACSIIDELDAKPYDLSLVLGGENEANNRRLYRLNGLLKFCNQHVNNDWLGVYQRLPAEPVKTGPSKGAKLYKRNC